MSLRCVTGDALTAQDVYDIWKIRDAVFAVEQLAPGGVLVIPVDGSMTRVAIDAERTPEMTRHGLYQFVPLIR